MKVLLDTNVLINGIFVPQSRSRAVLQRIRARILEGSVCENSIAEARKVIRRAYFNTGINLLEPFERTIKILNLVFLPRVTLNKAFTTTEIKGAEDKALVAIAKDLKLHRCTEGKGSGLIFVIRVQGR